MAANGAFTFVLNTHLPYARLAGRWPHGEEWIHEAAAESYVPLLRTLYNLKADGIPVQLTIGLTPVLCEQLSDTTVLKNFEDYLNSKIQAAQADMAYFRPANITDINGQAAPGGEPNEHLFHLANWYQQSYERIRNAFIEDFDRDIIGAFRRLQDDGDIEILTSAATHAYLPLMAQDSTIRAQLQAGIHSYERHFGRRPRGIWLPECAYRPAYIDDSGNVRPGIESFLAELGLKYFFSETHTITGGQPVGTAAGDIIGPYGEVKRRYVITPARQPMPRRDASTYRPYYVSLTASGDESSASSGVAVLGRNNQTGQQVWSAEWGYPGDFDYREFHKKAGTSGMQYWRVTGDQIELDQKDMYHPDWAAFKIDQHAEHFAHMVGDLLRDYSHHNNGDYGIIISSYDTELFGHWWHEGSIWLSKVLRLLSQREDIDLVKVSDFLAAHPPSETLHIPESSWGIGGAHFTWDNGETHWMWQPLHEAEVQMARLAEQFSNPTEDERYVLNQAAREVLLMQSSDWPFLITTGQARNYAAQRFSQHVDRFRQLASSLEEGQPDRINAEIIWELDKVFPDMDYRWFKP